MIAPLLLAHGDDSFGLDQVLRAFAQRIGAEERVEIVPLSTPDEAAIDRATVAAGTMGLFGSPLAVLRQPLRAAGRSTAAAEKLVALVHDLPDGASLALVDVRSSRDAARPAALVGRLISAVTTRGGIVEERLAPRRAELQAWTRRHAEAIGIRIEPRAAALLAERVGGSVAETDVERGDQTRVVDGELRKLAIYAGDRAINPDDVDELVTDTRPASLYAITNAIDRRDAAGAAGALHRALAEGQPVLRIMAALSGRVSDLVVVRDLLARHASPQEIARRAARGNARMAERLVQAANRYHEAELDGMLRGLFEADVAIKTNAIAPEPAVAAWLGEHLLGAAREMERGRAVQGRRPG
jgi:DNA polymerase III delta subunit